MSSDARADGLDVALEEALTGASSVVGVGIGTDHLPSILAARRRAEGETWRLCCTRGVVESLGRSFVLGTDVATAVETGLVAIRTPESGASTGDGSGSPAADDGSAAHDRTYLVADGRVHALAGPAGDRSLATTTDPETVHGLRAAATERFEVSRPADVGMPPRGRLYRTAREALDERFAADLERLLEPLEPGALDRSRTVTDRTVLVALGARHDLLFHDVRVWAESTGIASRQSFTADRRALVACGVIETVKVPLGIGHPNYRLRALDDRLLGVPARQLVAALREWLDGVDVDELSADDDRHRPDDDRPVWDRRS